MKKTLSIQITILFYLILLNFIAQIPYFLHLYYHGFASLSMHIVQFLIMGIVFAAFLIPFILFKKGNKFGYYGLCGFLTVEFLFYLYGTISSVIHGYGLFFQLHNPDILLRVIFAIGYMNLFASGYFLFLLLGYKESLLNVQEIHT